MDEFAHTNAPGSRHPKRYQDVQEMLHAGIDVYTTLNIQHVESYNDVVAQITGVRVRETVPDSVIDVPSEVELIDLPPDELRMRLAEGKVYVPGQAAEAVERFFRPGNLTALREIALRWAAQQVDAQMLVYMQTRSIPGPWPAGERLLVAVSGSPLSERLVRTTKRLADELKADWMALYIETPREAGNPELREQAMGNLALAERLGAHVHTLPGSSIAETLVDYARRHNVTKIIAGKPLRPRWRELLGGSVVDRVIKTSGAIDVYVISSGPPSDAPRIQFDETGPTLAGLPVQPPAGSARDTDRLASRPPCRAHQPRDALSGRGRRRRSLPGQGTGDPECAPERRGVRLLLRAPPLHNGGIRHAVPAHIRRPVRRRTGGELAGGPGARTGAGGSAARAADQRALRAEPRACRCGRAGGHRRGGAAHIQQVVGGQAVVLLKDGRELKPAPGFEGIEEDEIAVATWAFDHGQLAGKGTDTLPGAALMYLPLRTSREIIGVLGVGVPEVEAPMSAAERRVPEAFATLAALAFERADLAASANQLELLRARETLQSALLNSISHELRTPLASIAGVLSTLRDAERAERRFEPLRGGPLRARGDRLGRSRRTEPHRGQPARHDPTRVRRSTHHIGADRCGGPGGIGAHAARRPPRRSRGSDRPALRPAPGLRRLGVDGARAGQRIRQRPHVLAAADRPSTSPRGGTGPRSDSVSPIAASAYPPRISRPSSTSSTGSNDREIPDGIDVTRGIGLGLSISRGIVQALDGRIWAENRVGGGTTITVALRAVETSGPVASVAAGEGRTP